MSRPPSKADRFQTAGRLASIAELNKPRDEREQLRPITAAEVREREFLEVKGKREFQRWTVDRYVFPALARMLWPADYGTPGRLDAWILVGMSDDDIRLFVYGDDRVERLARFRDNLRAKMT
jgi:hypothetical protein